MCKLKPRAVPRCFQGAWFSDFTLPLQLAIPNLEYCRHVQVLKKEEDLRPGPPHRSPHPRGRIYRPLRHRESI
ncbi:hypothetical protein J6590_015341 [Homalodisca vitripennis]|nr:hypothetical protein J6590_015341 [Homalodisca vitripennis]